MVSESTFIKAIKILSKKDQKKLKGGTGDQIIIGDITLV